MDNEDANISIIQETQEHFFNTVENYKRREAEAKLFRSRYGDGLSITNSVDNMMLGSHHLMGDLSQPGSVVSMHEGHMSGPQSPVDPLANVLAAEAQAHTDVIMAAKTIQNNREAVYNSLTGTLIRLIF